jgi:hypothetical protein
MRNWKDDIELDWTLRDIYSGRLKLSPITEDQLQELLEMGLAEVVDDHVKLTETGYRKIAWGAVMARRPINKTWTSEDIARLISLADSGATVLRAAAALGRPATAVQNKARELGKPLVGIRASKAAIRAHIQAK